MASRPMPWWKFSTGTRHHSKVTRFVAMMGNRLADAYLFRLWDYCAEQRADGCFSGRAAAAEIAFAVGFDGPPDLLLSALVDSGLLDAEGDSFSVHDWDEMQSALVRKFDTDASRSPGRSRKKEAVPFESRSASDRVPRGTSAGLSLDLSISTSPVFASTEGGAGETVHRSPEQPSLLVVPEPVGPQPEDLQALWNRLAPPKGLQRWAGMSGARKRAARLSLEAVPDLGRWEAWLKHELTRPWNLGQNDSEWKADVNWLLRANKRDVVKDFDLATAAKPASKGDVPRLPPRETIPEAPKPTNPERRVIL